MNSINYLDVLMRWLHIMASIVAGGGVTFALFALLPSFAVVPQEARPALHGEVRRRFARLLMISIAALLVSGFYNYIRLKMPEHKGQSAYHALMGVKILLAFVVFFIGSALTGRSAAFEKMRARPAKWMGLNVFLIAIIVALAGILRAMPVSSGQ